MFDPQAGAVCSGFFPAVVSGRPREQLPWWAILFRARGARVAPVRVPDRISQCWMKAPRRIDKQQDPKVPVTSAHSAIARHHVIQKAEPEGQ